MKVTEYTTTSPEETKKIAAELASTLQGGEVIKAYGEMC